MSPPSPSIAPKKRENGSASANGASGVKAKDANGANDAKPRQKRGFALLSREAVQELARRGGEAAHEAGTAHRFTSEEARAAGRKGGAATAANRGNGKANANGNVNANEESEA